MIKRELLMLVSDYDAQRDDLTGWYLSEKLDGVRAFWDGGITANRALRNIPWANTGVKNTRIGVATGLWSRYGNVICAPMWFLEHLPKGVLLDGELWLDYQRLEETRSIVSRHTPDDRWREITYNVFDMPSIVEFSKTGYIHGPNFKQTIKEDLCFRYFNVKKVDIGCRTFQQTLPLIEGVTNSYVNMIEQTRGKHVYETLDQITTRGGEGVVMRRPFSFWTPHRSRHIVRIKPQKDAEAVVVGYKGGQGKHVGRLGSLVVNWDGCVFDLGGFTDKERYVKPNLLFQKYQGLLVPETNVDSIFEVGSSVTFRYNGLTNGGVPREARYWRKRPME